MNLLLYTSPKKSRLLISFLAATIVIFAYACGRDSDTVVVDFSKTVSIERPEAAAPEYPVLRVAVGAMTSPKETSIYYRQLLDYISRKLGREVRLVQRKTYEEINQLLGRGQIDVAFICSGPYASGREKYGFEPLGTPVVQGSHFYRSYLIVNKDSGFYSLEDLRGHMFAFTDPESNTGKLVPTYWTLQLGESPETFFRKTIYTYSHDNSIMAVARALVDGAAVDGLIWEYYHQENPTFTSATRIIRKSEDYGIPPAVASKYLEPEVRERIRQLLFSMHLEPEGQKILGLLMIDRFTTTEEAWYKPIRDMRRTMALMENQVHVVTKP
ncbi:MAG: phosphate/phosphite/phosphonate ABC transporter substrate-binding protein [Desulfobacteraceae bacterium]|jgi:phosphonate transport system substrate-binding protein